MRSSLFLFSILVSVTLSSVVWANDEFPAYPNVVESACVHMLLGKPTGDSFQTFMRNLNEMSRRDKARIEVPQFMTSLDYSSRQIAINRFAKDPSLKGLIRLLNNLLPDGTKFKRAARDVSVSLGPATVGEDASINESGGDVFIKIGQTRFYVGPFNMPTQKILKVEFLHNSDSPHRINWWRHLRILIEDLGSPTALTKGAVFQELNLYYDSSHNLQVIALRNRKKRIFSKWSEQFIYVPQVLLVSNSWAANVNQPQQSSGAVSHD